MALSSCYASCTSSDWSSGGLWRPAHSSFSSSPLSWALLHRSGQSWTNVGYSSTPFASRWRFVSKLHWSQTISWFQGSITGASRQPAVCQWHVSLCRFASLCSTLLSQMVPNHSNPHVKSDCGAFLSTKSSQGFVSTFSFLAHYL